MAPRSIPRTDPPSTSQSKATATALANTHKDLGAGSGLRGAAKRQRVDASVHQEDEERDNDGSGSDDAGGDAREQSAETLEYVSDVEGAIKSIAAPASAHAPVPPTLRMHNTHISNSTMLLSAHSHHLRFAAFLSCPCACPSAIPILK
ncbi:hypothetical protein D9619_007622 [Psilocybe cf. subviscida]|uniref:Uncharacterized protein n=1 Tax=Psilocybe cf. subviscida TaxID=2480587 RepID=A0A8H5ATK5_9AGAR|nr:hypothetical protein D9619_007622 [Psilocybe cf. subviscida]